ncbi:fumarylacetoacetate hydrolase family protein [Propylenella binzhouense]|uniref:FAA hydrolase family protein n=1 Tax=Propylenella binzhouense TaxID=2555902 RepID=A0A964WT53_9HYPH|nr:fumarylacetoacetate hydrolase family protein [Propylenella binzhouense]MYZ47586.1 FAA hydrolase family protein [Propylenella binzhouense]
MRFVTFEEGGAARVGVVRGEAVVPVSDLVPDVPASMKALIATGVPAGLEDALGRAPADAGRPLAGLTLRMPIADPGKIVCIGLNYHDHAEETGQAVPTYPPVFMRCTTSLVGPGEPMIVPKCSEQLDYEAELTVVIGRACRHVSPADALEYVFGYTLMNEGSVRDYQRKSTQWTGAKNFDRTGPVGPWITTADAVPPGAAGLRIRTLLNGAVMQEADTSGMIFDVAAIVSTLSEIMTLEPGDLIATGTPAGVGMGRRPPVWLKPGDEVTVEVEGVGALTNPVAAEA